jgi:hypothetical protein
VENVEMVARLKVKGTEASMPIRVTISNTH